MSKTNKNRRVRKNKTSKRKSNGSRRRVMRGGGIFQNIWNRIVGNNTENNNQMIQNPMVKQDTDENINPKVDQVLDQDQTQEVDQKGQVSDQNKTQEVDQKGQVSDQNKIQEVQQVSSKDNVLSSLGGIKKKRKSTSKNVHRHK
jgi:hypothetical protein